MPQRHRGNQNRSRPAGRRSHSSAAPPEPKVVYEKKAPIVYGKAFVVLEDESKGTFRFDNGAWVPYAMSIAQCRRECLVNELPQKVNRMTRYEIRLPVTEQE